MRTELVNIDWLSFSVSMALTEEERRTGAVLNCPQGYSLVELGGTNIYKRRYFVMSAQGEKLLTLLLEPHSQVIDKADMFVEVANKWLYFDLSWVMPLVCQIHECAWKSLSRLDICCDFVPNVRQQAIMEGLGSCQYYVSGKRQGVSFYDINIPSEGGQVKTRWYDMNWGSKGSNLKWKMYWKSREVTEVSEVEGKEVSWCTKPYIQQQWRNLGWDLENVWRLEFSVTSGNKYRWHGERVDIWRLQEEGYAERLFWDVYDTRFVIRANQGHKCRKWDELCPLFITPQRDVYRLREREYDSQTEYHEFVSSLRAAMKQLQEPSVRGFRQMREVWLAATENTIETGNLRPYFYRTFGKEWEEWRDEYLDNGDIARF